MSSPRSRSQHGVNRRSKHAGLLRIPKSFCKRHFCKGKRTERPGRRRLWCCCALPETCFFGQDCWCSASKTCWKASTKSGNQEKLCFVLILARTKLRASSMWGSPGPFSINLKEVKQKSPPARLRVQICASLSSSSL